MTKDILEEWAKKVETGAGTAANIEVLSRYIDETLEDIEKIDIETPYYKDNFKRILSEYVTNAKHLCWMIEDFAEQSRDSLFSTYGNMKDEIYKFANNSKTQK